MGLIVYSGIFEGVPAPKRAVLGFGDISTFTLPLVLMSPISNNNDGSSVGYDNNNNNEYANLSLVKYNSKEERDAAHLAQERAEQAEADNTQIIGSFWVNPLTTPLRLGSLRGAALSQDLIALPGTLLRLQVAIAAPGSPKFVEVGSPALVELFTAESGNLVCYGGPPVVLDIPVNPGTMVMLIASTSSHVRNNMRISATLSYF